MAPWQRCTPPLRESIQTNQPKAAKYAPRHAIGRFNPDAVGIMVAGRRCIPPARLIFEDRHHRNRG